MPSDQLASKQQIGQRYPCIEQSIFSNIEQLCPWKTISRITSPELKSRFQNRTAVPEPMLSSLENQNPLINTCKTILL